MNVQFVLNSLKGLTRRLNHVAIGFIDIVFIKVAKKHVRFAGQ